MPAEPKYFGKPEKIHGKIRYKKMHAGKQWKSTLFQKHSRDNEREAWKVFCSWRDERDRKAESEQIAAFKADPVRIDTFEKLQAFKGVASLIGDTKGIIWANDTLEILERANEQGVQEIREICRFDDADEFLEVGAVLVEANQKLVPQPLDEFATKKLIEEWLQHRLGDVRTGEVTAGTLDNYQAQLRHFANFCPDIRDANERLLLQFRSSLQEKIVTGGSAYTQRDTMSTAKAFLEWCSDTAKVIKPLSNLRKRGTGIKVSSKKSISIWEDALVHDLFETVTGQEKLFYLLMLNTGAYESDIGTWTKQYFDEKSQKRLQTFNREAKTITFKRHKERNVPEVPTVTYRLWGTTFSLLEQHISSHETLLLTSSTGTPLWIDTLKSDSTAKNKRHRKNLIGRQFYRLKTEHPNFGTLDDLRKTAVSKLDTHDSYARYSQYFAGHSPRGTTNQFYRKPSQKRFDEAVLWLGDQFLQNSQPSVATA